MNEFAKRNDFKYVLWTRKDAEPGEPVLVNYI